MSTNSPLSLYNEVAKDFNITANKQVHPRQKKAFVESQIQEQQLIINRLLVDTAMARKNVSESKDDTVRAAHQKKVSQYEDDLRQLTKTLDFFIEFKSNLDTEYPEAKSADAERPDGF